MKIKGFRDPRARFFLRAGDDAGGGGGGGGQGGGGGAADKGSGGNNDGGGNKGGAGDPWYQSHVATLDKDTLAYLDGKKFPTMIDALKSGAQSDKMARERNVIPRPDTADPAKLAEWEGWGVLGWNKDKNAYAQGIKPPKMPNGAQHDAALMDDFVSLAHEIRIPPAMAEKLFHGLTDKVNARLGELASQGIKDGEKLTKQLRDEWKGEYDARVEIGTRAAKAFGIGADDMSQLEKITGSPGLLKFFYNVGAKLGEANLVNADGLGGSAGMTPAAAEAELRRIEADPEFMKAFKDSRHPQNADNVAKWKKLTDIAAKGGNTQAARR